MRKKKTTVFFVSSEQQWSTAYCGLVQGWRTWYHMYGYSTNMQKLKRSYTMVTVSRTKSSRDLCNSHMSWVSLLYMWKFKCNRITVHLCSCGHAEYIEHWPCILYSNLGFICVLTLFSHNNVIQEGARCVLRSWGKDENLLLTIMCRTTCTVGNVKHPVDINGNTRGVVLITYVINRCQSYSRVLASNLPVRHAASTARFWSMGSCSQHHGHPDI